MTEASPNKIHLLSKSYPRSGHHYLANLLRSLYLDGFYYCEQYQASELTCCKTEPCTKMMALDELGNYRYPVSMQKSHDFELTDPVRQTFAGLKYLLFFRNFEPALNSAIKLFLISSRRDYLQTLGIDSKRILQFHEKNLYRQALAAIDERPMDISVELIDGFVLSSARHYVGFLKKWKAVAADPQIHTFSIQYEDLMRGDLKEFVERLVSFVGVPPKVDIDTVAHDNPLLDPASKKLEESQQAAELMRRHAALFRHYVQQVRKESARLGFAVT